MTDNALNVALLGTGIMGSAMARNLLAAGHRVTVWNRTPARAEALAADGAVVAADPAEAVRDADVVLTVLLDGPSALTAMRAAGPALRPGTVWTQCGTVGIEALDELVGFAHEHGLLLVDSPVLGTRQPAESGQLTVLAAGPQAARAVADQVFAVIGARTRWLAEDAASGAATRLKLVLNGWVLTLVNGTAEALTLAEGLGVDPRAFLDAVAGGPLDNVYLQTKGAAMLAGDFAPNFTVEGGLKDARLIAGAGRAAGLTLDLAEAAVTRLARARELGHGDADLSASYLASGPGSQPPAAGAQPAGPSR
ncbi:NAD(P)-dependent oxidoreductase [Streptacidiphilus cavernicola]|uniref:NAD(P)-dependent oxidoreductase n=1 Tax=Streptacidiphilus cavernicola TaxID=3342716 RepID=A0ABV6VYT4_9ACTN